MLESREVIEVNNQTDNKHLRTKRILKIIGLLLLVAGLIFVVVGLVDFFSCFGTANMPTRFWCLFVGLPLLAIGISTTIFAYRMELTRYIKNESVPIINEMGTEIKPAVSAISNAVKEGVQEKIICECGAQNDPDSKYCKSCGKSLVIVCPDCGNKNDLSSKFCDNCGKKICNSPNEQN